MSKAKAKAKKAGMKRTTGPSKAELEQIATLARGATLAGDRALVKLCGQALAGQAKARRECLRLCAAGRAIVRGATQTRMRPSESLREWDERHADRVHEAELRTPEGEERRRVDNEARRNAMGPREPIEYVRDPDTNDGLVSAESVPIAVARAEENRLQAAGLDASWAPDADDGTRAWVYKKPRRGMRPGPRSLLGKPS